MRRKVFASSTLFFWSAQIAFVIFHSKPSHIMSSSNQGGAAIERSLQSGKSARFLSLLVWYAETNALASKICAREWWWCLVELKGIPACTREKEIKTFGFDVSLILFSSGWVWVRLLFLLRHSSRKMWLALYPQLDHTDKTFCREEKERNLTQSKAENQYSRRKQFLIQCKLKPLC
jgi:hypothetical protein